MNEREYLDHHSKVTADNVTVTVIARNDDGTLLGREIGSGGLHRITVNPADSFKIGSRIVISRPSATRSVLGSGALAISRAPRDQRGLSDSTPAESMDFAQTAFIIGVDPDPLVLVVGGEPGIQTIIGRGFTSAAVYSGELADPALTNVDAPTVDPVEVVMSIRADADSPLGTFDATVGSAKARNALQVIAPAGPLPPYFAILGTASAGALDPGVILWVLDPITLAVVARSEVRPAAVITYGLTSVGGIIYWITELGSTGNDYRLHAFNPATGIRVDVALASTTIDFSQQSELRFFDGLLFICSRNATTRGLMSFNTDGSALTLEWADSLVNSRLGLDIDADSVYVTASGGTKRLDRVTFAQEATTGSGGLRAMPLRSWAAGVYGAFTGLLCVAGTTNALWLNASSLTTSATVSTGNPHHGPVQINDKVYLMGRTDHVLYECSLDGTSVTSIATMDIPTSSIRMSFSTDGAGIFYARSDDTVRRVGVDGVTTATSAVLTSSDPTETIGLDSAAYISGA